MKGLKSKCVLVMGINKYDKDKYAYVFDTFESEELAKKAIIERGTPLEEYRLFECNFLKNITIEHKLKEN